MIYGIKYNTEKNEICTSTIGNFVELKIACSSPVWLDEETLITAVEAESLEEANHIAIEKFCKYFGVKREEALKEATKYTLEASKYEKFERDVKCVEYIVGDKKKIYSVCYFADNEYELSARELPDEDDQIVCDKVYRTNDLMYEVFVEAMDEKEAEMKGAECIAKFIEDKRQEVRRQIDELSDIEGYMGEMAAWLRR